MTKEKLGDKWVEEFGKNNPHLRIEFLEVTFDRARLPSVSPDIRSACMDGLLVRADRVIQVIDFELRLENPRWYVDISSAEGYLILDALRKRYQKLVNLIHQIQG